MGQKSPTDPGDSLAPAPVVAKLPYQAALPELRRPREPSEAEMAVARSHIGDMERDHMDVIQRAGAAAGQGAMNGGSGNGLMKRPSGKSGKNGGAGKRPAPKRGPGGIGCSKCRFSVRGCAKCR